MFIVANEDVIHKKKKKKKKKKIKNRMPQDETAHNLSGSILFARVYVLVCRVERINKIRHYNMGADKE